ncbi:MAG: hypothetical protein EPN49_16195 [Rhodanobacter sp.]|nr:MAG: hypothetical protein EPN49_16195 [Rhodanobacter sp.]
MDEELRMVIVPVEFEDGTKMYVQAVEPPGSRRELASASDITGKFKSVADAVRNIAKDVKDALAAAAPDEAQVEFGLDLAIESGGVAALVCKGDAKASLKILLKWSRE